MNGVNKMIFNQGSMVEALQLWADKNFAEGKAPRVTCVRPNAASRSSFGDDTEFEVTLDGSPST